MRSLTSPSVARTAGQLATLAFGLSMLLQLALALGLLPITMAWGGSQSVLTPRLRLASLFAVLVLALAAVVIRRRAGLAGAQPSGTAVKALAWVITGYLALNTLGNLASASMGERLLFAPLTFAEAVLCLIVSLSRMPGLTGAEQREGADLLDDSNNVVNGLR